MRPIRYIFDLPWWAGLPVFLIGNAIVPFGILGYSIGLMISLFGCWTFSKLLKPNPYSESFTAISCISIIVLSTWFLNSQFTDYVVECSYGTLFVLRAVFGLFFGLLGFQAFRK